MMKDKSLKNQMLSSLILTNSLIILLSAALVYLGVIYILKQRSEQTSLMTFQYYGNMINNVRDEVATVSQILMENIEVKNFIIGTDSDSIYQQLVRVNDVHEQFKMITKNYDYIYGVFLFDNADRFVGITGGSVFLPDYDHDQLKWMEWLRQESKDSQRGLIWRDLVLSYEFQNKVLNKIQPHRYLIMASRQLAVREVRKTGTLIILIDQSRLVEIYNLHTDENSEVYMINSSGVIISHRKDTNLGNTSLVRDFIADNSSMGSFRLEGKQVVYYRIPQTDWTLIKEIPLSEFVTDALSLRYLLFISMAIGILCSVLLTAYWIRKWTAPIKQLIQAMIEIEKGNLGVSIHHILNNEMDVLSRGFNRMSGSILELIRRNKQFEEQNRLSEAKMLQSQMNPHFLLNTLNTIKWMAKLSRANHVVDSIDALVKLLRPSFQNPTTFWTMKEEFEYVQNYLKIINIRYGEGIEVHLHLESTVMECNVLRFLLQPIIENAVQHGLENTNHKGIISVDCCEKQGELQTIIRDNGCGMGHEKLQSLNQWVNSESKTNQKYNFGTGLSNVHRRIQLLYGDKYGLFIESSLQTGTKVTILTPFDHTKIENASYLSTI